jgi:hypothetical protein
MVRPDENIPPHPSGEVPSGCVDPAGVSPARGDIGVPVSRPQSLGEIRATTAGRHKLGKQLWLFTEEQARGRQHEVKPAASSDLQRESRAAHVTAKATSTRARSGHQPGGVDLPGVLGVARVHGPTRNRRDPSALPESGQGASHKAKSKASAAQRKSEGVVVPSMAATNNAVEGKGPCFGHVGREGKRAGMVGSFRPKLPLGISAEHSVPQPPGPLRSRAKRWKRTAWSTDPLPWHDTPGNRRRSGRNSAHARARGPSASRVRENREHGLTGGPEYSSSTTHVLRR